jgi:hypothetical protein
MADAPRRTGPRHFAAEAIGLVVIPAGPRTICLGTSRLLLCVRVAARTMACRRRALEAVEKVVTGILLDGGPGPAGLTLVVTGFVPSS